MEQSGGKSKWNCLVECVAILDQAVAGSLSLGSVLVAVVLPITPLLNWDSDVPLVTLLFISAILIICSTIFMAWFSLSTKLSKVTKPGTSMIEGLKCAKMWQSLNGTLIILMTAVVVYWSSAENLVEKDMEFCFHVALYWRIVVFLVVQFFICDVAVAVEGRTDRAEAMEMV